ncbi:MAG: hypothetical protein GWN58_03845 [Anaerolineae bacterium]|nr:hypothetical protein [Anaerolineae bacterium]
MGEQSFQFALLQVEVALVDYDMVLVGAQLSQGYPSPFELSRQAIQPGLLACDQGIAVASIGRR